MGAGKRIKLHNKSDKPDNVVLSEHEIIFKCEEIQKHSFRIFLKNFSHILKEMCFPEQDCLT